MYTPAPTIGKTPNRDCAPSVDEARNTKKHIVRLEVDLKNPLTLEETERRLIHIKRDLEEHKLHGAPIRSLPFEILSYIFATCCMDGALTALRISAVCHRWRNTILATPVAWSRVSDLISSGIMSTVLERSGMRPLHVKIFGVHNCPKCREAPLTATSERSCPCGTVVEFLQPQTLQRIDCLHTSEAWMRRLSGVNIFSTVRRLRLRAGNWGTISIASLNAAQFPVLRSLDISNGLLNPDLPLSLPPLEELKFQADIDGDWVILLQMCAKTLKRLNMRGKFRRRGATTAVLEFPTLESLVIYDWVPGTGTQLLQAITPTLTCYRYSRSIIATETVLHEDVANVVHLRTTENFDLSSYPRLRVLQVGRPGSVVTIFDQLGRNPDLCPSLEVIQIQGAQWVGDVDVQYCKQVLQLHSEKIGSNIQLIQDDVWRHPIPGCDEEACVGVHSPGSS